MAAKVWQQESFAPWHRVGKAGRRKIEGQCCDGFPILLFLFSLTL